MTGRHPSPGEQPPHFLNHRFHSLSHFVHILPSVSFYIFPSVSTTPYPCTISTHIAPYQFLRTRNTLSLITTSIISHKIRTFRLSLHSSYLSITLPSPYHVFPRSPRSLRSPRSTRRCARRYHQRSRRVRQPLCREGERGHRHCYRKGNRKGLYEQAYSRSRRRSRCPLYQAR